MKEKLLSKLSGWLKGVSNDSPCGEDFVEASFEYQALAAKVEVTTESSDWKKHKQEMEEFLIQTKDIRLYSLYTRILIHTEKNPLLGLSKGLQLILYAIENYWDCCYPIIDESDPEEAFFDRNNALADFASYKDLILPLSKKINILSIGLGHYTLEDLIVLDAGGAVAGKQPLQGLMPDEEAAYAELLQYFNLSLELADAIKIRYHQKSNEVFTEFNDHLLPMLKKGVALSGGGAEGSSETSSNAEVTAVSEGGGVPPIQIQGTINNREDIIKALGLICDYYEKNEPSSPVPMMLERVVKMVDMNYREIFSEFQLGADSVLDKIFGQVEKK
jgi:type VI secretion system protein ImpA